MIIQEDCSEYGSLYQWDEVPHKMLVARLLLCLDGECELFINSSYYHIRKGDIMVSMPDNVVLYREKSPNFKSYSIAVGENFINNIQMQWKAEIYMLIKENPCISLSNLDMEMLIDMCDTLQSKYSRLDHPYRNKICEHQLLVISYEIAGLYSKYRPLEKVSQTRKHQILQQFLMLVADNYTKSRKVEFYAEKMCMTPKYLSSSVKEASDVSATQWIARTVISNAKYMLSNSDLSVQQISDHLNFPNPSFFGQYFKSYSGMTPLKWRISHT